MPSIPRSPNKHQTHPSMYGNDCDRIADLKQEQSTYVYTKKFRSNLHKYPYAIIHHQAI